MKHPGWPQEPTPSHFYQIFVSKRTDFWRDSAHFRVTGLNHFLNKENEEQVIHCLLCQGT